MADKWVNVQTVTRQPQLRMHDFAACLRRLSNDAWMDQNDGKNGSNACCHFRHKAICLLYGFNMDLAPDMANDSRKLATCGCTPSQENWFRLHSGWRPAAIH